VCELVHLALKLEHLLAREELGQRALARSVQIMIDGREAGDRNWASATGVELMLPFVADAAWSSVDLVGEVRVGAVQFVGVDSHNGSWMVIRLRFSPDVHMQYAATLCVCVCDLQHSFACAHAICSQVPAEVIYVKRTVALVHAGDRFSITPNEPPVVVRLVQVRSRCDLGTRKSSQWMVWRDVVQRNANPVG
jgi:hypothetical protein